MKWINQNKFLIAVATAAVLAFFCLRFFLQAMKADNSLDAYKLEMRLKEESRQIIIKDREPYLKEIEQLKNELIELRIKNAASDVNVKSSEQKVSELKNTTNVKKRIEEKVSSLNDSRDIVNYINNLPQPNDY